MNPIEMYQIKHLGEVVATSFLTQDQVDLWFRRNTMFTRKWAEWFEHYQVERVEVN